MGNYVFLILTNFKTELNANHLKLLWYAFSKVRLIVLPIGVIIIHVLSIINKRFFFYIGYRLLEPWEYYRMQPRPWRGTASCLVAWEKLQRPIHSIMTMKRMANQKWKTFWVFSGTKDMVFGKNYILAFLFVLHQVHCCNWKKRMFEIINEKRFPLFIDSSQPFCLLCFSS